MLARKFIGFTRPGWLPRANRTSILYADAYFNSWSAMGQNLWVEILASSVWKKSFRKWNSTRSFHCHRPVQERLSRQGSTSALVLSWLMSNVGSSSTGATLASCVRQSLSKYPYLSSSMNFEWLVQAAKHITRLDAAETIELSAAQLPPKSLAAICIACKYLRLRCQPARVTQTTQSAYFNNVHVYYPIIRGSSFQSSWEAFYDPAQKSHYVSDYILFCLVLTIGAASDRGNSTAASPLDQFSRELFQKACTLVYTSLIEASLVALQVILLLVSPFSRNKHLR